MIKPRHGDPPEPPENGYLTKKKSLHLYIQYIRTSFSVSSLYSPGDGTNARACEFGCRWGLGICGSCRYGQGGGWPLPPDLALRPPEEDPVDLNLWIFFCFFGG